MFVRLVDVVVEEAFFGLGNTAPIIGIDQLITYPATKLCPPPGIDLLPLRLPSLPNPILQFLKLSLFSSICSRDVSSLGLKLRQYLIYYFNVFFKQLYGLRQQFVTLFQVVGLLVAARNIVRDDAYVDGFDKDTLLLVLYSKDF